MARGLTIKQNMFVKGLVESGNGTQAALGAYNTSSSEVAKVIASENLTKLNVREAVEQAMERNGLSVEYISGKIKDSMVAGVGIKAKNSDTIRAGEVLLKLRGAFPTKQSASLHVDIRQMAERMSYGELKEEYERLKRVTDQVIAEGSMREKITGLDF